MSESPTAYRVGNVIFVVFQRGESIISPDKIAYSGVKTSSRANVFPFPDNKETRNDHEY